MNVMLEIDGRWIQVLSKTIEINGKQVVTQGDIKIFNSIMDVDDYCLGSNWPDNAGTALVLSI